MRNSFLRRAEKVNRVRRKHGRWTKLVSIMACAVVFCTTYALILPALTIETGRELICTETDESHVHTDECYRQPEILPEETPPQPAQPSVEVVDKAGTSTDGETPAQPQDGETPAQPQDGAAPESGEESSAPQPTTMRHEGADYSVTVTYGAEAGLPENVELSVRELEPGTWEYQSYYDATLDLLDEDRELLACRFFDVSFLSDGTEVEPEAPVDVQIDYAKPLTQEEGAECTAVHFADTGVELLDAELETSADGGDVVTFTQDSFSVVGTAVTTLNLSNGSYIFYKNGYAIGVNSRSSDNNLVAVKVTVDENGYVYIPGGSDEVMKYITWTYDNGCLKNTGSGKYLNLISGAVVSTSQTATQARIINNVVRFSAMMNENDPATGINRTFYLGLSGTTFTSKSTFANGDYFTAAKVETVSDNPTQPYELEVKDDIRNSGTLVPSWTNGTLGGTLTYRWYRSDDGGNTWKPVERKRITGDSYNVAEDGSWLNVALDGGADKEYRLELVSRNGTQVSGPTSHDFHVPYYDSLQNGDFENPKISTDVSNSEHYQPLLPNGTAGMVWKTTASDEKVEYISVATKAFRDMSAKWHNCPEAASGVQFVELNATMDGALYQDVLTTPGSTMYWQLSHRGRGISGGNTDGTPGSTDTTDTMYVVIMSTKLAEQYDVTTQAKVEDVVNHPDKYPGAQVKEIKSDCQKWYTHKGDYTVPDDQYLTRYFFVAGPTSFDKNSPGSALAKTVGNHLDNVYFSTELPPPSEDEANLKVIKTIKGLSEEDARYVFSNLQFTVLDNYDGTQQTLTNKNLDSFVDNGDGTYTGTYMLRVTIGTGAGHRFTVTELTDTAAAPDRRTIYNRTTSAGTSANRQTVGSISAEQFVSSGGTASFYFTNSYEETYADFAILKVDEGGSGLRGAQFQLEKWDGETWSVFQTMETSAYGRDSQNGMSRNTLFRLTEIKAPDGYQLLTEPVYFKIERVGGTDKLMPHDANGNRLEQWPADVSLSGNSNIQLRIVNHKGMVLPSTGGTGTTGFYIAGAALMGAAVLYGLRRKREEYR